MIWYNVYDIFVNHKSNWIPNLNDCEEMQPERPHMIDNQKSINPYIRQINKDESLSNFDKYCATRLMSLDMAVWCKKNNIWGCNKTDFYKTTNYDNTKFVWDPDKNADGTYKNYTEQLNFKYAYTEYSAIDDTMALDSAAYLYNDDFIYNKSGTQNYMCISLYRFFKILQNQFGFYIRKSPMDDNKIIAYYIDNNKATLLRSNSDSVEFTDDDYDILIDKIFNSCKLIQKSL